MSQPAQNSDESAGSNLVARILTLVVIGLVINALILLVSGRSVLGVAKLFVSEVALVTSIFCFWVVANRDRIFYALCQQEQSIDERRDDVMFELTATRERLSRLESKLNSSAGTVDPSQVKQQLVKYASSAVMMLIQKEKSMLQWAMWAAKLGKTAYDYFNKR